MKKELIIEPVTQTLSNNCTSACLSMVTNIHINEITDSFHKGYVEGTIEPYEFLESVGCKFERVLGGCRELEFNNIYIAGVPSLNIEGGMHHIIFQINRDMTWYIIDPNLDREEKLVYVAGEDIAKENPNYRTIKSWTLDYKISFEEVKRLYMENKR